MGLEQVEALPLFHLENEAGKVKLSICGVAHGNGLCVGLCTLQLALSLSQVARRVSVRPSAYPPSLLSVGSARSSLCPLLQEALLEPSSTGA